MSKTNTRLLTIRHEQRQVINNGLYSIQANTFFYWDGNTQVLRGTA